MRVWLARDENGDLSMFDKKPCRKLRFFIPCTNGGKKISWWIFPQDKFPNVTWENSPQEYELELKLTPIKEGGEA